MLEIPGNAGGELKQKMKQALMDYTHKRLELWWAHKDSNLGQSGYESAKYNFHRHTASYIYFQ